MLSVLAPIAIIDAMLISSAAPETDYAVYSAATTYAVGDRCISTSTHRIYESLQAGNINHDPTDINNRIGTTPRWLDVAPTNKWAMFDGVVSTQTVIASPLTVVLRPGFFNALYLGGLDATGLTITVKDAPGGNVIFSRTDVLEGSAPGDYWEYFFDPFRPAHDYITSGIEPYHSAEITVTLTGAGTVKCGILAFGDLKPLGETQYGAKAKPKTYSYIKVDDWGNNTIVRRKATTDMTASAMLDISEANSVREIIQSVLDVPCVWIGSEFANYAGLRVFGLGSGEISYDHPKDCLLSINVQGLI